VQCQYLDALEKTVNSCPDLPVVELNPCMSPLDESRVMYIGGAAPSAIRRTFILDLADLDAGWVRGPVLNRARVSHACGLVRMVSFV